MELGVIEEIALDAPDFVVHLPPLGAGIDADAHTLKVERTAGAAAGRGGSRATPPACGCSRCLGGSRGWRLCGGDVPVAALAVEDLLAVGRNGGGADVFEEPLRSAFGQVEAVERQAARLA